MRLTAVVRAVVCVRVLVAVEIVLRSVSVGGLLGDLAPLDVDLQVECSDPVHV